MSPTDAPPEPLTLDEIREGWSLFDGEERADAFRTLVRSDAEDFFLDLTRERAGRARAPARAPASGARGCACSRPTTPPT